MKAIYVEKRIPNMLMTKAIAPLWPGFVWTPLSASRATEFPDPPLPGPRWLRLENEQCGICSTDLSLLFVQVAPSLAPAALPGVFRFWLGHETVSVVTETGPGVTRFRAGERAIMDTHFYGANCFILEIDPPCYYCADGQSIFCLNKSEPGPRGIGGGFGDRYIAHETAVYSVPDHLSRDQAMMVEPTAIAVHGVLRCPPKAGDKVLVLGAGVIALLYVSVIHALCPEAEVTVLARYPYQQEMAEKLGAKHILSDKASYRDVARITGGRFFSAPLNKGIVTGGFDIVYDCVGTPKTITDALRWTRAQGTVVVVGLHMKPMKKVDLSLVWYHQVDLIGAYVHGMDTWKGQRKHTYEWVLDLFREKKLPVESLITHRFPYSDYEEAIRVATSKGEEKAIKVVFERE
jgi:threonine dehydrogenase-like Zn-dependent dehydrogenase